MGGGGGGGRHRAAVWYRTMVTARVRGSTGGLRRRSARGLARWAHMDGLTGLLFFFDSINLGGETTASKKVTFTVTLAPFVVVSRN